jgi:hypothetical protein
MKTLLPFNTHNASRCYVKTIVMKNNSNTLLGKASMMLKTFLLALILFSSYDYGISQTTDFGYTGGDQTYTVPAGVTKVQVRLWGAGGGGGNENNSSVGGGGAYVIGYLDVTPGEVLTVMVGQGGLYNSTTNGTVYGGGRASGGDNSGWGGGRSAICRGTPTVLANNIVVAGGGGDAPPRGPGRPPELPQ